MTRALFAELSCSYLQDARPQTVLVENPKTLDEKGKLVSLLSLTLWLTIILFYLFLSLSSHSKWTMNYQSDLTVLFLSSDDPGEQCRRWCHLMEKMTKNFLAAYPKDLLIKTLGWTCITIISSPNWCKIKCVLKLDKKYNYVTVEQQKIWNVNMLAVCAS